MLDRRSFGPIHQKNERRKGLTTTSKELVWHAFKAEPTPKVMKILSSYSIESVMVPKNKTHLLQPLDLTTNASFKTSEKRTFSECFTSCIMEALTDDPDWDVTTIIVDLHLSLRKSLYSVRIQENTENFEKQENFEAASCKSNDPYVSTT